MNPIMVVGSLKFRRKVLPVLEMQGFSAHGFRPSVFVARDGHRALRLYAQFFPWSMVVAEAPLAGTGPLQLIREMQKRQWNLPYRIVTEDLGLFTRLVCLGADATHMVDSSLPINQDHLVAPVMQ